LSNRTLTFLLFFSLVLPACAQVSATEATSEVNAPESGAPQSGPPQSGPSQSGTAPSNPTPNSPAPASAPRLLDRMNFTAGAGLGIGRDDVASFVGNSGFITVGAGWSYNRRVGFDAEYMFYDLPFRSSVIKSQALAGQSGYMQSISLNAIINTPLHYKGFGTYGIFGVGFYDRHVALQHPQL
jgi:hypothetical protein